MEIKQNKKLVANKQISLKEKWKLVIILNFFNALDAILTLYAINNLDARELNPLMSFLIEKSPLLFVGVKLSIAALVSVACIKRKSFLTLKIAGFLFIAACVWNLSQILFKVGGF